MPSILEGVFSSSEDELNKMLISLVGMPKEQIEAELSAIKTRVEEVAQTIPTKGNKGDKGDKGDKGIQGPKGEPGRDGRDGFIGKDGKQGIDGKDGKDGKDGVSIVDVNVAFDNHLVVTLSDGTEIDAGVIGGLNENLQNVVANYVGNSANGTLIYKGLWNASTNTPTLTTSNVDAGSYYVVSVAGSTNLSGITDWQINDWAIFNGTEWQKIDNSDLFNPSAVAITGGAIDGTTIGSTTASTGKFTSVTTPSVTASSTNLNLYPTSTGNIYFNQSLGGAFGAVLAQDISTSTNSARLYFQTSSGTASIWNGGGDNLTFRTNATIGTSSGTEQFRVTNTASAVNYVQVTGGATGTPGNVFISAQGSDSNIRTEIRSKGTGEIVFGNSNGNWACTIVPTAFAVNRFNMASAATNQVPVFSVIGSDTNVPIALRTQGTGAIDLAAGSSGVNISNGGTVTALTRTNVGAGYTSVPTITISAPTTAGGVQATASVTSMGINVGNIASGGTGYAVNDEVLVSGGTFTTQARYRVTAVSGGVVTAITIISDPNYQSLPTNPASTTTAIGTGSGLTININWAMTAFSITNAGSGYIEQPTVSFSGGGGSGASAYATVGSRPIIQSLGTTSEVAFAFRGPSATGSATAPEILRLMDTAASNDTGILIQNSQFGRAQVQAYGNANGNLYLGANGSGRVSFTTNGTSLVEQMRVSHTASAVNYVQVTGSATGQPPAITAQGSDANVNMTLRSKGTGYIGFTSGGGSGILLGLPNGSANYFTAASSNTGSAPILAVAGSDTNIDLSLTTKGTGNIVGNVNSGTFTLGRDSANNAIKFTAPNGNMYVQTTGGGVILFNTADGSAYQMRINHTASAVNYIQATGGATTASPSLSVAGSDANIDLALTPKGTGRVKFGTYTANMALTIQGYIEILDSGGTIRKLAVIA